MNTGLPLFSDERSIIFVIGTLLNSTIALMLLLASGRKIDGDTSQEELLAWVISEEGFMNNINAIQFFKTKGKLWLCWKCGDGKYTFHIFHSWSPGHRMVGSLASYSAISETKAVEWEKQVQLNVGLDFTLLNDRINGSIEYFDKDSRDLLVSYRIGSYHGYFRTNININLGELNNRGFDFNIETKNLTGNFQWTTNFNISRAFTEVTRLSPFERNIDSGTNRVVEGQPLGAYFLPILGRCRS